MDWYRVAAALSSSPAACACRGELLPDHGRVLGSAGLARRVLIEMMSEEKSNKSGDNRGGEHAGRERTLTFPLFRVGRSREAKGFLTSCHNG